MLDFESQIDFDLVRSIPKGETPLFTKDSFSFYTSVASVYSSKMEGEPIEADSYMKHKYMGVKFQPNYTKKTDDLFKAYTFAQKNPLNTKNLFKAWFIASEKYYYQNLNDYYRNLQVLGFEYETLNFDRCLPFLLMLPTSLNN